MKKIGENTLLVLCCGIIYGVIFALYHLPVEAAAYPTLLCLLVVVGTGLWRRRKERNRRRTLEELTCLPEDLTQRLEEFDTPVDRDYRAIIEGLSRRERNAEEKNRKTREEDMDYYTTWAHQIKTPIASMRLALEEEDSKLSRQLREELLRIEQYAQMVMAYQRLGSDSTDYVFREYSVDGIIRGVIRKFAPQFIGKGLALHYEPTAATVITDEKWLSLVLEQVVSNALKYTAEGSISIRLREDMVLEVRDTGMGIAPEDLPRIIEKGFTGYNGRTDNHSSGLGLYLCRRVCDALGYRFSISSKVGEGTAVELNLSQVRRIYE